MPLDLDDLDGPDFHQNRASVSNRSTSPDAARFGGAAGALASGAMASALIAGTVDAAHLDGTEFELAQSLGGGRRNGKKKSKSPANKRAGRDASDGATPPLGAVKKKNLQHNALNAEDDKYEYYTSEDEHGRRIQKMRKKKRRGAGGRTGQRTDRSRDRRAKQLGT